MTKQVSKLTETRTQWITVQRNRRAEKVSPNAACRRLNNPEAFWETAEEREAAAAALATLGRECFTPAAFIKDNELIINADGTTQTGKWVYVTCLTTPAAIKKAELAILTYAGPADSTPSLMSRDGLVYKCTPVRYFSEDIAIKLTRQAAEHAARLIDRDAEKKAREEKKAKKAAELMAGLSPEQLAAIMATINAEKAAPAEPAAPAENVA